jgi:glycosyltransferase involved in cell wall biosynthesis
MKLAIFLPGLYEGGAERVTLHLAEAIASQGYDVDLVLVRAEGPNLYLVPRNIRMIDLHSRNTFFSLFPLIAYLIKEKPHALLSGLFTNILAVLAVMLTRRKTKVVICEHNTLSVQVKNNRGDWRFRLMPVLARMIYPKADQIVAVSEGVREDLSEITSIPGSRIRVIYNPVITPELIRKGQEFPDHPWFQPGQPPVILGMGRLVPVKDFDFLIEVFSLVRKVVPARLIIFGEGPERTNLQNLIRGLGMDGEVHLPGFIENPYPFLSHSALFVLSSRHEGLPGVLIEAMAFGIPLISTDCPSGPREILEGGKHGRLVPVGDRKSLEVAILDGLEGRISPPDRNVWKRFGLVQAVNQYLDVLFPGVNSPSIM